MRNSELNQADADGVLEALMNRLRNITTPNAPPLPGARQRPMSIVEVTEALIRQAGERKRS